MAGEEASSSHLKAGMHWRRRNQKPAGSPLIEETGEAALCPREEQGPPPIRGHSVDAWNQSPRLWLLVFRDKVILLIW